MNRNFLCLRNKYFFFRKSITKINYLYIILLGMLSGTPLASWADTIDLVCVDSTGFSMNFTIDTSKQYITYGELKASGVSIETNEIQFHLALKDGSYFHIINRSNGNLTIRAPNGGLISGFKCDRAKPKF